jgi:uncharacterized damage-inducible protein DinB
VPALLQPVAHALLQACEEVESAIKDFPEDRLWNRPGGVASVGFHLQHLTGVQDRLFTYARGESLSAAQLQALAHEESPPDRGATASELVTAFQRQVERSLDQLRNIGEDTLTQPRTVGRGRLPSTVLGLLVHAAEHTQRHVGQLLVTVRIQQKSC